MVLINLRISVALRKNILLIKYIHTYIGIKYILTQITKNLIEISNNQWRS